MYAWAKASPSGTVTRPEPPVGYSKRAALYWPVSAAASSTVPNRSPAASRVKDCTVWLGAAVRAMAVTVPEPATTSQINPWPDWPLSGYEA